MMTSILSYEKIAVLANIVQSRVGPWGNWTPLFIKWPSAKARVNGEILGNVLFSCEIE